MPAVALAQFCKLEEASLDGDLLRLLSMTFPDSGILSLMIAETLLLSDVLLLHRTCHHLNIPSPFIPLQELSKKTYLLLV